MCFNNSFKCLNTETCIFTVFFNSHLFSQHLYNDRSLTKRALNLTNFPCYNPSHHDHKAIKMVLVQGKTKPPK